MIARQKVWIAGEVLTASDLNAEFDNIINNLDPGAFGGVSSTLTEKRTSSDPSSDLATTLEDEVKQIRYQLNAIIGKNYWYEAPSTNIQAMLPTGIILPYGGSSAPSGYLLCYGQAVSRTTYSTLFSIIGTAFGSGDGSTTFNVPDLRGRFPLGKDNMGGVSADRVTDTEADTIGSGAGSESHYHTGPSHTHTVPDHYHGLPFGRREDGAAVMYFDCDTYDNGGDVYLASTGIQVGGSAVDTSHWYNQMRTLGKTASQSTGSEGTGNTSTTGNKPPYQTTNYIIKT